MPFDILSLLVNNFCRFFRSKNVYEKARPFIKTDGLDFYFKAFAAATSAASAVR